MSSALIIFGGIRIYKKFANTTAFIKWGAAALLILVAIIMMFADVSTGDKAANIKA
jgi:L-asparagine transporter-like permease